MEEEEEEKKEERKYQINCLYELGVGFKPRAKLSRTQLQHIGQFIIAGLVHLLFDAFR